MKQSFTERMQAGKDNAANRRSKGFAVGCHKSWRPTKEQRPIAQQRIDARAYQIDKHLFDLADYYQAWLANNQRKTDAWYESMIAIDSGYMGDNWELVQ